MRRVKFVLGAGIGDALSRPFPATVFELFCSVCPAASSISLGTTRASGLHLESRSRLPTAAAPRASASSSVGVLSSSNPAAAVCFHLLQSPIYGFRLRHCAWVPRAAATFSGSCTGPAAAAFTTATRPSAAAAATATTAGNGGSSGGVPGVGGGVGASPCALTRVKAQAAALVHQRRARRASSSSSSAAALAPPISPAPSPTQRPQAQPLPKPTVPSHWPALGAPFTAQPYADELWAGMVTEGLRLAAALGRPLGTPFGMLMRVPRARAHLEGLDASLLKAMVLAKDEMREVYGSWQEVRRRMKLGGEWPPPAGAPEWGRPVVLRATFREQDITLSRVEPSGWSLSGRVVLERGQLRGMEALGPAGKKALDGLEITASWTRDGKASTNAAFAQHMLGSLLVRCDWVLSGVLKPMPIEGCRFEMLAPDRVESKYYSGRAHVATIYRASAPLSRSHVAKLVEKLLNALDSGKIALPDPLPPVARDELLTLLTANGADSNCTSNGAADSAGAAAAPTPVLVRDAPSLLEAFKILHRPHVEHFQPCAFRRPGGGSRGTCSGGVGRADLSPTQAAGVVVAFHELFFSQLRMQQLRRSVRGPNWAPVSGDEAVSAGLSCLGFSLTGAQRVAVGEVLGDMRPERASTMYRLLQGDVASGKTAVALLALLAAASCGLQGVLVAPTGVLAQQHGAALAALLGRMGTEGRRRWGLPEEPLVLLGEATARERRSAHSGLADGSIRLAVGTHALLNVPEFARLGLLVLDESQKFGVAQMEALSTLIARRPPHLLNMTATPIPRTLAAAMYGHMDVSRLDELPPGRTPVRTTIVQDDSEVPYEDPGQAGGGRHVEGGDAGGDHRRPPGPRLRGVPPPRGVHRRRRRRRRQR